jgi:NADH:ubiquinone oxidoreductase subunit 5 (subunit L)/multisubunit Na+/H+ antiporter MnhA subunit
MDSFIHFFLLLPLLGFLITLAIPGKNENALSTCSYVSIGLHMVTAQLFLIYWLIQGQPRLDVKDFVLLKTADYEFFLDFSFDKISAVYLFVGSILAFLVTMYSRYYLHRENGYKRFFNTILFFYTGYNVIIFSGNLETMFIGWEILGISSFLLIAFYRDRYLPVKNATKVFSIYRIGDVGLILAMWMTHHLFHENVTFAKLNDYTMAHEHLQSHTWVGVFISMMFLLSAAAKSGQFPFSSWVPRAMEGPTPSSAIFYGSLSVHIGVFLMLRTFPFWEHQTSVRIFIVLMGLTTAIISTGIARVQSSIKSQIAYASVGQIGLIFIEIAAGFNNLALLHFAGNAFLRTYQLLVSPSVVSYLIREQFYNFSTRESTVESSFPLKLQNTLYILCLKEWNLDSFMYNYWWNPLKWAGNKLNFLTLNKALIFFFPTYLVGLLCVFNQNVLPPEVVKYLPYVFSLFGVLTVLKSFTERIHARLAWSLVVMNHFWVALAISFNEHFSFDETYVYLSGVIGAGVVGFLCLRRLKKLEGSIDLDRFHGHSFRHPKIALIFLLACLGVSGFPISPTFIGEDLIFSHIHEDQMVLAIFSSLSVIIDGIAIVRIYARVFLGPHSKSVYEMAYRSS